MDFCLTGLHYSNNSFITFAVPLLIQTKALELLLILSPFGLDMVATVMTTWSMHCRENSMDIPVETERLMETFCNKFKDRLPYLSIK
jgi:hypothetical protein